MKKNKRLEESKISNSIFIGKIENIRNFVEYKCKPREERELFKSEILKRYQKQQNEMLKRIEIMKTSTEQFDRFKRGKEILIKIEGDGDEFSDVSQSIESMEMRRHRDMPYESSFSFLVGNGWKGDQAFVYEQIIQKLEADVRTHIKIENQLKLIIGI